MFVLCSEKELSEDWTCWSGVTKTRRTHDRSGQFSHTWRLIVFCDLRKGRMTDIERYKCRLPIVVHAGWSWMVSKEVMQQRDEYEDGDPSHRSTLLKKGDAVNVKVLLNQV